MKLPNGYGSVHKLSGKRRKPWRVRKFDGRDENGKAKYLNVGYYETSAEAFQALAEYNANPWDVKSKDVTLDEIYQIILKQKEKEVTPQSFKIIKSIYTHAAPLADIPIAELKTNRMQDLINNLDRSQTIKRKVKTVFTDVFKYALKNDIVKRDYASLVEVGKATVAKKKITVFSDEEIRSFMPKNEFHDKITKLLVFTGFRINELLGLKTENINLTDGIMIGGSKTDAGKERIVPISRHIRPLIEEFYTPGQKYLLVNSVGKMHNADNLRRKWKEDYPDHGFHECRHTFSSVCNNAGVKKLSQQLMLGHVPSDITDRVYTHKSAKDLTREMEKFDAYIDGIIK